MARHYYFISYSEADGKTFALQLADDLTAYSPSMPVWVAARDLRAAVDWDEQVVDALYTCAGLLFVVTKDSVHLRSECKHEWMRALRYRKPIIPLRFDREAEMPFRLEPCHYIDFTGDYKQGLARLRNHIRWRASPEGALQSLKERLADAERELARALPQDKECIEEEIEQFKKEIEQLKKEIPRGPDRPSIKRSGQPPCDHAVQAPEMLDLPGGSFRMGDIQGAGKVWERPVHEVTLDAFAIGRNPLTVGEFARFVQAQRYQTEAEQRDGAWVYDGKHISHMPDANWRNPYISQDDHHPVVCISWNDAVAYCEWLSEQTGKQYSLPTEAEWEYACRADNQTKYYFGNGENLLEKYAWYAKNAECRTHPVRRKKPNRSGLHEMHGNVWEWVQDWFGTYSKEPQHNPSGAEQSDGRVVRGGAWGNSAERCRSSSRGKRLPGDSFNNLGFRLAMRD